MFSNAMIFVIFIDKLESFHLVKHNGTVPLFSLP